MIDFSEIADGEAWEAFCRDYLSAMGLVVSIPPGRGPDDGRDLLVKEQLKAKLTSRPYTWLVSCKHYAVSGRAIGTELETNITDRMSQHSADGFIGFYSTQASAALIERLKDLRDKRIFFEFTVFDGSRIERGFHDVGLSGVLQQHLPSAHTALRPIHPLLGEYKPLKCEACGKDLLRSSVSEPFKGIILFVRSRTGCVEQLVFACKGACDRKISAGLRAADLLTGWDDISDYCNPLLFMRRITGIHHQMRDKPDEFSNTAHEQMIQFYLVVSQRTLRQTSSEDRHHFLSVHSLDELGL